MTSSRPSVTFLSLWLVVACVSCHTNDPIDNGDDPPDRVCLDYDGDEYGENCEAGPDCDDLDDMVWDSCEPSVDRCSIPRLGCPCETEGEEIVCRTVTPVVSGDGSELCYAGTRVCEDGLWSACENMDAYEPVGTEEPPSDGANREALIELPEDCTGSCDSGCKYAHHCPSGIDLTPATAVNLRYDLAIPGYDAAVVLESTATVGYFRQTIEAICDPNEMPVWWSIDHTFHLPGGANTSMTVRVETTDDGSFPATPLDYTAVSCTTADCTPPTCPDDRVDPDDGNIYNALPSASRRLQYLHIDIELRRNLTTTASPRLEQYDVYYFCDAAS